MCIDDYFRKGETDKVEACERCNTEFYVSPDIRLKVHEVNNVDTHKELTPLHLQYRLFGFSYLFIFHTYTQCGTGHPQSLCFISVSPQIFQRQSSV